MEEVIKTGIALCVLIACLALSGCSPGKNLELPTTEFENRWREQSLAVRRQLPNSQSLKTDLLFFVEMEDWCRGELRAPRRVEGSDRDSDQAFLALREYYRSGQSPLKRLIAINQELESAGGADFVALLSPPDKRKLENHFKLIKDCLVAIEALSDFEKQAAARFKETLIQGDLKPEKIEKHVQIFTRMTSSPQRTRMRTADETFYRSFHAAIQMVLEEWAAFEASIGQNDTGSFTFSTPEVQDQWMKLMQAMVDAKSVAGNPMRGN